MTAGSGIIHQEMPKGDRDRPHARLPTVGQSAVVAQDDRAALSGSETPTFPRSPTTTAPTCASSAEISGARAARSTASPPTPFISTSPCRRPHGKRCRSKPRATPSPTFSPGRQILQRLRAARRPTEGVGWADTTPPADADNRSLVVFDRGDEVRVQAGEDGIRFLLVSGKPLEEPVAWYGPIVMNTQEQLQQAFQELEKGTFLKIRLARPEERTAEISCVRDRRNAGTQPHCRRPPHGQTHRLSIWTMWGGHSCPPKAGNQTDA
jgi:quercetin 2,3-dioxygenase